MSCFTSEFSPLNFFTSSLDESERTNKTLAVSDDMTFSERRFQVEDPIKLACERLVKQAVRIRPDYGEYPDDEEDFDDTDFYANKRLNAEYKKLYSAIDAAAAPGL